MATQLATMPRASLSQTFADTYGIGRDKVSELLKETVLKGKDPVTDAEVAAFMVVCNQYGLNPFIKEIFGFVSKGKMQYVVSVDGWSTLINRQPTMNGIEFEEHFEEGGKTVRSITCKIHRTDRALPILITEYFSECNRTDGDVWKKWPIRMLRHKAMIQCARIAFGLAGVIDEDEAERMEGYQAPVIEGARQAAPDAEVDSLMTALNWSGRKRENARQQFSGNRDGLLAYLKAEKAKLEPAALAPVVVAQRQEPPADELDEAEDEPATLVPDEKPTAAPAAAVIQSRPATQRTANW